MPMQQAFSYNFSTVENPLSDSGNFVTINESIFPGGTLKTVSGNLCEAATARHLGMLTIRGHCRCPRWRVAQRPVRRNHVSPGHRVPQ